MKRRLAALVPLGGGDQIRGHAVRRDRSEDCAHLPVELAGTVEFFHVDRYNAAATIQDNVLFGKIAYGQAQAVARASKLITEVLADLKIQPMIMLKELVIQECEAM